MKTLEEKKKERLARIAEQEENVWDIWADDAIVPWHLAPKKIEAPKRELP